MSDDQENVPVGRKSESPKAPFVVPRKRIEKFYRHELEIEELIKSIDPHNQYPGEITLLYGHEGIGKTEMVLEAAYRIHERDHDCAVFWVATTDLSSYGRLYRKIGHQLGVEEIYGRNFDPRILIKEAFQRMQSWLIIIDDFMPPYAQDISLLRKLPHYDRNSSIALISRLHHNDEEDIFRHFRFGRYPSLYFDRQIKVTKMGIEEAKDMIQLRLGTIQEDEKEIMEDLLMHLECIPLAINQASAYIASNTDVTISQYISTYESAQSQLEKDPRPRDEFVSQLGEFRKLEAEIVQESGPIATTWRISFEHILQTHPDALEYLKSACLLAKSDIPLSLLSKPSEGEKLTKAIDTLKAYGFVIEGNKPDSLDIHQCVRYLMRDWLRKRKEFEQRVELVIQQLTDKYPPPTYENRDIWMGYLPHAKEALELQEKLSDKGDKLLFRVTASIIILERDSKTVQYYREILKKERQSLERDHSDTIEMASHILHRLQEGPLGDRLERRKEILEKDRLEMYDGLEQLLQKAICCEANPSMDTNALVDDTQEVGTSRSTLEVKHDSSPEPEVDLNDPGNVDPQRPGSEETCKPDASLTFNKSSVDDSGSTSELEESEDKTSFLDLISVPRTLPELVDMIFSLFGIPPSIEEPVSPGMTRIRYRCECGAVLYYDVLKHGLGSPAEMETTLTDAGSIPLHNNSPIVNHPAGSGQPQNPGPPSSPAGYSATSAGVPRQGGQLPGKQTTGNAQSMYLLLLIDEGKPLHRYHEQSLQNTFNDKELFELLRDKYKKLRGQPLFFTLRSVKSVSLATFRIHDPDNKLAELHERDLICSGQDCVCFPPKEKAGTTNQEYRCSPVPENSPDRHPVISRKELTHYFKENHTFTSGNKRIYTQVPKKTELLKRDNNDEMSNAWGIYFEEGWHWRTIYLLVFLTLLGSLTFGIVWAVVQGSIGDAFTAASFGTSVGGAFIALLAWRSTED
ncbi:uncharacterized protein GGS22DRAFT_69662 [Annulohypoxylon maeteangense]|uniref:uncharacterized protein n=1 Tax=Annulohypoxylon maeteangense TaxID=1927788 RepID=UPI0020080C56|nr:uncharacterized protein GGS22DRAFT_69662 [Annulohypoxylon maeteangense]KAI0889298.1 hypothetical protein GGS22DRAFT_69662 [Annulohypoxylon maeteangense]